ncbi:hypothetical protein RMCBS344292_15158 [Rhizopus microsporus]|nr:hypothetical protein RMCBS344292_15158 [Rhizopus microsporus]
MICRSLSSVSVLPTLASGVPTTYDTAGMVFPIGSSSCVCVPAEQQQQPAATPATPATPATATTAITAATAPAPAPASPTAPASREEDWLGHLKRARDGLEEQIAELDAKLDLLVQKRRRLDRLLQDE